jgi:tRNA/rRNA methyltransferase
LTPPWKPPAALYVVLVEPAGPLNVGSVARLCANFGISGLRLVAPRCDPLDPEARRMAVHGLALLEGARQFPSLEAAIADCVRVVAATGRLEGPPLPLLPPAEALAWLLEGSATLQGDPVPQSDPVPPLESLRQVDSLPHKDPAPQKDPLPQADVFPQAAGAPGALVFGREDRGLANGELLQAGRLVHIGTGEAYASLNLSHAVAVVLHELHGLRGAAAGAVAGPAVGGPQADPCRRGDLEAALADAEALLLEVGFLLPHTSRARMAKLRALLQRGQVTAAEVALLRGMVCQLRWASRRGAPAPEDL